MNSPAKTHDSLGRSRRVSQGGAGPKPLPSKDAPRAGEFDPRPPDDLGEYGLKFWTDAVKALLALGFVDHADRTFLIHASEAFQDYKENREIIRLSGKTIIDPSGIEKVHPLTTTMQKDRAFCFSFLSSLGLTPSARAKFGGTGGNEDDPIAEIQASQKWN